MSDDDFRAAAQEMADTAKRLLAAKPSQGTLKETPTDPETPGYPNGLRVLLVEILRHQPVSTIESIGKNLRGVRNRMADDGRLDALVEEYDDALEMVRDTLDLVGSDADFASLDESLYEDE